MQQSDQNHYLRQLMSDLQEMLTHRLQVHFNNDQSPTPKINLTFSSNGSPLSVFLTKQQVTEAEYLLLALALAPHIQPHFLSTIIAKSLPQAGDYPELGGVKDKQNRGFLPTGETALFLLAGNDFEQRFSMQQLLSNEHWLAQYQILYLESVPKGQPKMSGQLLLDEEFAELFTTGKINRPNLSTDFPAQYITTQLEWDDLVLNDKTAQQIHELQLWVEYNQRLLDDWEMDRLIKPGYRALFHGPPGTGKTLTATLLGKYTNKDVYKIDLSVVVSKYIGETEKNLARLFDKAANKNWILFFDEADALFGKRTNVRDAHDKYANQEVSYLLQRIETYPGLTILASNFKSNIDEAFTRRFQSIIYFPIPGASERFEIWQKAFPKKVKFSKDVDLRKIAQRYPLTGAHIVNVVQYACLRAMEKGKKTIELNYLIEGIRKEYDKEGKTAP